MFDHSPSVPASAAVKLYSITTVVRAHRHSHTYPLIAMLHKKGGRGKQLWTPDRHCGCYIWTLKNRPLIHHYLLAFRKLWSMALKI